tara:strand:+ start:1778 stop:1951 length:174 start_codon:yes stop_codon:yes gene_type:complete
MSIDLPWSHKFYLQSFKLLIQTVAPQAKCASEVSSKNFEMTAEALEFQFEMKFRPHG